MLFADMGGAEYGIVGVVALSLLSAVLWFIRHIVAITLPGIIRDLCEELHDARIKYHEALVEERATCERRHEENRELHAKLVAGLKENSHGIASLSQAIASHYAVVDHLAGIRRQQSSGGQS